jgi:hypothetical protein
MQDSCGIYYENKATLVMQPHWRQNFEKKEEGANNLIKYRIASTRRFKIVAPGDNFERMDSNLQARYRKV